MADIKVGYTLCVQWYNFLYRTNPMVKIMAKAIFDPSPPKKNYQNLLTDFVKA